MCKMKAEDESVMIYLSEKLRRSEGEYSWGDVVGTESSIMVYFI